MKNLLTAFLTFTIALSAIAEVPSLINYQGRLTGLRNSWEGGERYNESGEFKIKIFDQKTGGKLIYQEDIGVVSIHPEANGNNEGVYSFGFGENGHSILDFSESLIVQEAGKQVFDYTLTKVPVDESLSIEAGGYNWNEKTGSSDAGNLLVQYDKNKKSAKIVFLNGSPDKDSKLKFSYRIKEGGIIPAFASSQNNWLELAFGQIYQGKLQPLSTFSPRERLVSVPFALTAKTAVNVLNPVKRIAGHDQMSLVAEYSLKDGNAYPPKINFTAGRGNSDYSKRFYLTPGTVEVQIFITGAHLYSGKVNREEYIKNLHFGVTLHNVNPYPFNIASKEPFDVNVDAIELIKNSEKLIDAVRPGSRPGINKTFTAEIPIEGLYYISFQSKPYYPKDSQRFHLDVIYSIGIK